MFYYTRLALSLQAFNEGDIQLSYNPRMPRTVIILLTGVLIAACSAPALPDATPSRTPTNTPIAPSPSLPPATATQHAHNQAGLLTPKTNGTYLVGVQIGRGVWRSDGQAADPAAECYWLTRKANGIILKSYFGPPVVQELAFSPYDYEVSFENCGTWTFLHAVETPPAP